MARRARLRHARLRAGDGTRRPRSDFRWWALFVLIPGAVISATGFVYPAAAGASWLLVASLGAIVFATGVILMFGDMPVCGHC